MTPEILWTDAVVLLLAAGVIVFLLHLSRQPLLRAQWARVFERPTGLAAAMVVAVFVAIGLLDSLHYRDTEGQIYSVFDRLVLPLKTREERTYSAPFATHAYVRENRTRDDGRIERIYPRLEHGGVHLADPEERMMDIGQRGLLALGAGLLTALVLSLLVGRYVGGVAALWSGLVPWPWRTLIVCLALIVTLLSFILLTAADYHLLGTDKIGQDVLYQSLKSIRTGLVIGAVTTLVMLPLALLLGVSAGYFGGWVDDVIQYLYTTLNSIPGVLLIAAAVLSLQVFMHEHADWFDSVEARADARLLALCLVLGLTNWTGLARLVRAETLKLREIDFVRAANALGVGHGRVLIRHIVPNLMHIVLISVVLDFSILVLAEAVLSYVGIGVDASTHSWGNMINGARLEMAREPMVWWSLAGAFCFMFTLVLAVNFFSDAVREVFDPRA